MGNRRKVGTTLDETLLSDAKNYARDRGLSFNELIEEALRNYLSRGAQRPSAVHETRGTYSIKPGVLEHVMEEDLYGSE